MTAIVIFIKHYHIKIVIFIVPCSHVLSVSYMQKTCDVAEKAILAKKKLRKKCVNRDKM